jgi:uncharacterized membrane protein
VTEDHTSFEAYPLTRNEYITSIVHLYRGEMQRATAWRARLDATTNWAVVTSGAMLSFAFSQPTPGAHVSLLLANVLVLNFLGFEARRFRYFDVWRSRIRMMEENFFLPILRRNLVSPRSDWSEWVAEDLDHPTFKFTFLQAVGMRLRRNYAWLFLAILIAWFTKLELHPFPAQDFAEIVQRMDIGSVPGPAVLAIVVFFEMALGVIFIAAKRQRGPSDEVEGLEKAMEHWKT